MALARGRYNLASVLRVGRAMSFKRSLSVAALAATLAWAAPLAHAAPGEKYPQTKTRVLTNAQVAKLSPAQRQYAINEIYARHGLLFGDIALRKQFLPYPWYKPEPGLSGDQIRKRFNSTEKRNVERLALARAVAKGSDQVDADVEAAKPYASPYKRGSQGLAGEHFPETRLDQLRQDDLYNMSDAQLRYAINEMYARHGFNFGEMALRKQFLNFGWYKPKPGVSMATIEKSFSPRERDNLSGLNDERGARTETGG